MATLADAAVEIIAELDSFEPDLRRKLIAAVQSAADDAEKEFRKAGRKSGRAFSDAVAQATSEAVTDDRFRSAGQVVGSQFADGFASRANRVDLSSGFGKAVKTASRQAEADLRGGGERGAQAFSAAVDKAAKSNAAAIAKIRGSVEGLEAAFKRAGERQIEANEAVERAERALAKTKRETSLVTVDGVDKIIAAEQRLAKARRAATRAGEAEAAVARTIRDNAAELTRLTNENLAAAGTSGGRAFEQNLRKAVTKASDKTGKDAGGFFSRAFQTAAARSIGSGLVKTFAALGTSLAAAVSPLGTILGGASAALVALAGAIVQASGAAVAFGGVLASLGLAAGTLAVGFTGVGDAVKAQSKALAELAAEGEISAATQEKLDAALKSLAPNARAVVLQLGAMAPAWRAVQQVVQNNLFAGVAGALRDLGARFLPVLTQQLGQAATTLSRFATGFAAFLTATPQASQITTILGSLNRILQQLLPAVQPLAAGFLTLFVASLPFAERLAATLSSLATRFQDFATATTTSGGFTEFMEGAFEAASNLLGVLGNVGRIIGTVFSAGAENGNSLLGVLEELTGDLAAFLASAEGQSALASFFGLIGAAGKVLQGIFDTLGPAIAGVQSVFTTLTPVLQQLGTALQPVILAFSQLIGSTLTQLAPIVAQLVTGLTPLIVALGTGLVTVLQAVLQAIIPILPTIVQFATALATGLVPVVQALAPVLAQIATAFGQVLLAIVPILPSLIPLIPALAQILISFVQLIAALTPLITLFARVAAVTSGEVAQGLQVVIPYIVAMAQHMANVINVVTRVVTSLVNFVARAVNLFLQFKNAGASTFQALAATVGILVGQLVTRVIGFFSRMISETIAALRAWATQAIAAAKRVASGILDAITSGLSKIAGALKTAGSNAIQGFVDGLSSGLDRVRNIAGQIASAVTGPVGRFLQIGSPSRVMRDMGDDTVQGYINGIREKIPQVQAALGELARAVPNQVKTAIGQVNTALGSLGSALTSTTRLRLNTLVAAARTTLGVLQRAHDSLDARSKAAQENLKNLLQQSQQFTSQVFSNIVQQGSITGGQDQSFAGIVARLTQARDAAKRFQEVLAQLSRSGLSKESLRQIAEAGPEAGLRAGEAVLAAGKAGIQQINRLQAQLQAAAQKAATTAANALFGQGIRVAEGIVAGIARQRKALDSAMQRLGDVLVARIISVLRSSGIRGLRIPGFADGGLISRPTLATFAEKGPEVAIPLHNPTRRDALLDRYFGGWADQRAFGRGGGQYGAAASVTTKTREVHMPITVQGLSKDETVSVLSRVVDRRFGPRIGITTSGGEL